MRRALITGVTGQDGSYLAEFLLAKGYEVHGTIRKASTFDTPRISHLYVDPLQDETRFFIHYCDLADSARITHLAYSLQPDEIYHLGAQSHVRASFDMPEYTADVTGVGAQRVLEAVRRSGIEARVFNAATSELFGNTPPPQNEQTPFQPRSPYAAAKLFAYWSTVNYRDAYGIFACNGILFNHESPRRGETFVTRKTTRAVANILAGRQKKLYLGNMEAKRDWGYAPEFVECLWLMLQQDRPKDYVIGTGESHSVQEFVEEAFTYADMDWREYVEIDPRCYRPTEVDSLCADVTKARQELDWSPQVGFKDVVRLMVDADVRAVGLDPPGGSEDVIQGRHLEWSKDGEMLPPGQKLVPEGAEGW